MDFTATSDDLYQKYNPHNDKRYKSAFNKLEFNKSVNHSKKSPSQIPSPVPSPTSPISNSSNLSVSSSGDEINKEKYSKWAIKPTFSKKKSNKIFSSKNKYKLMPPEVPLKNKTKKNSPHYGQPNILYDDYEQSDILYGNYSSDDEYYNDVYRYNTPKQKYYNKELDVPFDLKKISFWSNSRTNRTNKETNALNIIYKNTMKHKNIGKNVANVLNNRDTRGEISNFLNPQTSSYKHNLFLIKTKRIYVPKLNEFRMLPIYIPYVPFYEYNWESDIGEFRSSDGDITFPKYILDVINNTDYKYIKDETSKYLILTKKQLTVSDLGRFTSKMKRDEIKKSMQPNNKRPTKKSMKSMKSMKNNNKI